MLRNRAIVRPRGALLDSTARRSPLPSVLSPTNLRAQHADVGLDDLLSSTGLEPYKHQNRDQTKDSLDPDQGQYQVPLVDPTSELHDPLAEAHWPVVRAVELAIIIFTPPALAGEAVGRLE